MKTKLLLILSGFLFSLGTGFSQTTDDVLNLLQTKGVISASDADSLRAAYAISSWSSKKGREFGADLEFRPRTEFRHGYSSIPTKVDRPAFFTNQRTRITFKFNQNNDFKFQTSIQDVRVWGDKDFRSTAGTVQIYEAWGEPVLAPEWSVRIGRQKLVYDNERLFAQNNWRQTGSSFDAAVLKFDNLTVQNDLVIAWNQSSEQTFSTKYTSPSATNPLFKALFLNFTTWSLIPEIKLTSLQAADGFEDFDYSEKINFRLTNGGRVEYKTGEWYGTVAAYYQSGKNPARGGKDISAWYVQPEVKLTQDDFIYQLGAEVFSGTYDPKTASKDNSFQPLYGVAHRFNGAMDIITSFPKDVGSAGLVNPYFFTTWAISPTLSLKSDFHLFYTQTDILDAKKKARPRFLGAENDWLVNWKVNAYTNLEAGFSFADAERTLTITKGAGDPSKLATWSYIQLTYKPSLFLIQQ